MSNLEESIEVQHRFGANEMFREQDLLLQFQIRELLRRAVNLSDDTKVEILKYEIRQITKESAQS